MAHARLANFPERLAAGAFIANSGLSKLTSDKEHASKVHGTATGAYPFLEPIQPGVFTKALGLFELALGSALMLPTVSDRRSGTALVGFSGGLLGLYFNIPGMRQEGSLRPSERGMALAKDVWLLGIGLSLVADRGRKDRGRKGSKTTAD
jgi:hypothetical protein